MLLRLMKSEYPPMKSNEKPVLAEAGAEAPIKSAAEATRAAKTLTERAVRWGFMCLSLRLPVVTGITKYRLGNIRYEARPPNRTSDRDKTRKSEKQSFVGVRPTLDLRLCRRSATQVC